MSDSSISEPANEEDLQWWLELAPNLTWTWAKTYADFAPHWYVAHGKTPGMTVEDYLRVGRIIRTFGEPGKFWRHTQIYLFTPDRARKFWCMFEDPPVPHLVRLVNLATTERIYGSQTDFDEEWLQRVRLPQLGTECG